MRVKVYAKSQSAPLRVAELESLFSGDALQAARYGLYWNGHYEAAGLVIEKLYHEPAAPYMSARKALAVNSLAA